MNLSGQQYPGNLGNEYEMNVEGVWINLVVEAATIEDAGKGIARIPERDMAEAGLCAGDIVTIVGLSSTVTRVVPNTSVHPDPKSIQMDGIARENAGVGIDDIVRVRKCETRAAETVLISPIDTSQPLPQPEESQQLALILRGLPVLSGNKIEVAIFGFGRQFFRIEGTAPQGPVIIDPATVVNVKSPDITGERARRVSYEDIGGLENELQKVREIIEFPMKYPELFQRLGIDAPKGLLLVGPSGTGKTLIARAVASEVKAHFIHVNGPEIMQKFYGESEAKLRQYFAEANANAPSVVFLDEIDAIAPKRTESIGNVEKRVVAQLLVLMDGLVNRGKVVVIGATNVPNLIDPALRRPGRFDREIPINPPNNSARLEILRIHSRRLALHTSVDLPKLAEMTHGFVGADLEALVKEAGMLALRRILADMRRRGEDPSKASDLEISVRNEDFSAAFRETEPSALREFLPEKSNVRLADVGGLGEIKDKIARLLRFGLERSLHDEDMTMPVARGFFFSGAPGTGKTLLAKALAGEFGFPLISLYSSALFSRYIGESEKELEEAFRKARQVSPCILLLDEIDSLAPTRRTSEDSGVSQRMVSQLLREIDKSFDLENLVIIATTNRPELVDPAFMRSGRFDYVVNFPLPDESGRKEILGIHSKGLGLSAEQIEAASAMSEGLSGADIESACRRARIDSMQRRFEREKRGPVLAADLAAAGESRDGAFIDLRDSLVEIRRG
jgi:transitional endoplasmic reticulum ATPase